MRARRSGGSRHRSACRAEPDSGRGHRVVALRGDSRYTDVNFETIGVNYRPFLNNTVIFNFGAAALVPGQGFQDIYTSETLYSFFMGMTLTY